MDIFFQAEGTEQYARTVILRQQPKKKSQWRKSQEEIEDILFLEEEHPVCGWIVCVKGPRRGKDYRVMDGKNFVGRADDMDIQILGDNKIARRTMR